MTVRRAARDAAYVVIETALMVFAMWCGRVSNETQSAYVFVASGVGAFLGGFLWWLAFERWRRGRRWC